MGHYFDEEPAATSDPGSVQVTVGDHTLALTTDAGVFSRHRLDPGTAVLLRKAPPPPVAGAVLDLGCGYGPIACALAVQAPDSLVWAVDVNERARALTEANATANGLANVVVAGPDDVPRELRFDAIYSNPPVRVGKDAMDTMLDGWLQRLVPHQENPLAPDFNRGNRHARGGRAFLVVQRNLGADSLHRRLQRDGFLVERLASSKGYRVLVVAGSVTARIPHDAHGRRASDDEQR
jgi:16S rRNA (guanine1207-N2)-methyltransferase